MTLESGVNLVRRWECEVLQILSNKICQPLPVFEYFYRPQLLVNNAKLKIPHLLNNYNTHNNKEYKMVEVFLR
jgi:hypothetical protein